MRPASNHHANSTFLLIVATFLSPAVFPSGSCRAQEEPELSSEIPHDVGDHQTAQNKKSVQEIQDRIDNFSWETFVALNWPANPDGTPADVAIGAAAAAERVWEGKAFMDPKELFEPGAHPEGKIVMRIGKGPVRQPSELIQDAGIDLQAGTSVPVIDQEGNYAVSEIRINGTMSHYLKENQLLSKDQLIEFVKKREAEDRPAALNFPAGDIDSDEVGAIEIKAAWRVFPEDTPDSVKERYHWRTAKIQVPGRKDVVIEANIGLVGFHIAHKTRNHTPWLWATFEHVDNAPPAGTRAEPGKQYTFNDGSAPDDTTDNWQPNPVQFPWSNQTPFAQNVIAAGNKPTNVTHCTNEVTPPHSINRAWQAALKGTCWENYMLNGTQWYDQNAKQARPVNHDKVSVLRNSTLETYLLSWTTDQKSAYLNPVTGLAGKASLAPKEIAANSNLHYPLPVGGEAWFGDFGTLLFGQMIPASAPSAQGKPSTAPGNSQRLSWSSCLLCHQMARWSEKVDGESYTIYTDMSFVLRTFLQGP